jgi:K+-transporting ATPase ATPase C chain
LGNAESQLACVAAKWAADLNRDSLAVREEIKGILQKHAAIPFNGLTGEKFVNVFEINMELRRRFGPPA